MKNFYYTLLFLGFSLWVSAQTTSPTGTSQEVGITEGQLSVSLSGGATYSIPIAVPPGINGVVPQVSLAYNSQGGNGMAGYGWNVSGVSAITRISRTKFHDGVVGGVNLDANDRFALDGQRLILKTGTTYGTAGTTYETENFSNVKITAVGVSPLGANYGPASFKVEYPDGSVAYYGNDSGSRSITTWGITYWENPQGVRISYNYILANNNLSIEYIKYGSTGANTAINQIQFVYVARQRPEQSYVGGQSILMNTILKEIKTTGNGVGFRNYVLTPTQTSLGYERLESVTEKSGDNTKSYNPTVFSYDSTNDDVTTSLNANIGYWCGPINGGRNSAIAGDFDNDGKSDVVLYTKWESGGIAESISLLTNLDSQSKPYNNSYCQTANGRVNSIFTVNYLKEDTINNFKISPGYGWCIVSTDPNTTVTTFNTYSGTNKTINLESTRQFTFPKSCFTTYNQTVELNTVYKEYFSGDFNGDQITDVIALERGSTALDVEQPTNICTPFQSGKTYFVNLDKRIQNNFVNFSGILDDIKFDAVIPSSRYDYGTTKVLSGDANGDGKTDLIVFRNNYVDNVFSEDHKILSIDVYTLNDSNILTKISTTDFLGLSTTYTELTTGDFNGDGKTDIMNLYNGHSKLFISTGNSFVVVDNSGLFSSDATFPLDFDNDGKSDILSFYRNSSTGNVTIRYRYNKNNGIFLDSENILVEVDNTFLKNNGFTSLIPTILSSEDEYRRPEFCLIGESGRILRFKNSKNSKKENLLKSTTTGNGVKETITYSPLKDGNGVYSTAEKIENYPNIDIVNPSGFQVVSKLEKQSSSVYKKQLFAYYGAVSNMEGLGFLGFRSTVSTNWHDDTNAIISSISKFDIEQRGANVENYTVLGWHDPLKSTGKYKPNNIVKSGAYTITGSENLVATQSIVLKPNSWIQAGSTFTAKINPNANVSPNTPTDYITKSLLTYESELLSNKVFKIKNVLSKQHNNLENTNSETTTIYDAYNNPKQITTLLKEGASVVQTTETTLGYDDQPTGSIYYIGRPTSKTKSVTVSGDSTTSDELYEYTNNLLTKVKKNSNNSDNIVEDNEYDTFGNITKKTITVPAVAPNPAPAPRVTNYEYNPASPYNGRFLTKSKDIHLLETQYNFNPNNGVLNSETNPYGLTTSYTYDPWFKKKTTTDYLGKKNTYNYWQLGVLTVVGTTGDDGSYSSERFDDIGRKIQTYSYGINGSADASEVKYEYDIYDRQVKVFEPNNTSQWSETKYDEYGRVKENISYTGKTVTMIYPSGTLTSIVNEGTKTKTYTKNAMGNVVSLKDETPTTIGTISYTYFANGNLKTTNYDGVETKIEQDLWGRKEKLIDPSAGEYKYTYNGFGETTSEITPNGTTTYNLDDYGRLATKTIIGGKHTNSKTTYNYDSTTKLLNSSVFEDLLAGTTTNYSNSYDDWKRLYKTEEVTPSFASFTKEFTFDSFGRVEKQTSTASINGNSSVKTIKNTYKNGYPWQILSDDVTPKVLWQANTVNARGQLLTAKMGNGVDITNTYDEFGFITQFKHDKTGTNPDNVMTLNTAFDPIKGNLKTRDNNLFGWSEDFTNSYDDQDRLTTNSKEDVFLHERSLDNSMVGYETENEATLQNIKDQIVRIKAEKSGFILKKTILTEATIGDKISINLKAYPSNFGLGKIYIQEIGQDSIFYYKKNLLHYGSGVNIFEHTVAQNSKLVLRIEKEYDPEGSSYLVLRELTASRISQASQTYDSRGRITQNSLGKYNYANNAKVYQNTSVELTAEAKAYYDPNRPLQTITYNTFKSPVEIIEQGIDKISFTYNDNNDRSAMFYGSLDVDKNLRPNRKFYSADGTMEIKTTPVGIEFVTYIGGDAYSAPIVVKSNGVTQNYLYLHRDYQGSILAITDENAAVLEKRLFDAWGSLIAVQNRVGVVLTGFTVLDRGYTGHEHLQSVALINMNGRIYDPKLHRFLQPDNNIQEPFNTQNYNRYSYVLNNPLKYTDPSGEFWGFFAAMLFTSYANGVNQSGGEYNPTKWNSTTWTNVGLNGLSFVASGVATNYTNNYIVNYSKPPEIGVTATSGVTGGDNGNNHPYVSTTRGDIHMPTQHNSLGFNWTYLSKGKAGERFIYNTANTISIFGQYFMGRGVGDGSMRNLDGSATTTDEGVMAYVSVMSFSTLGIGNGAVSAADVAAGWQGKGAYSGVDTWRNVALSEGKQVVGGLPGQSNYYTTLNGLNRSGLNQKTLFEGLQVAKHPLFGYRGQVGIYKVTGNTPAAFGTTYANPQFGAGGLPQIFIPDYSGLQLIKTIPLK